MIGPSRSQALCVVGFLTALLLCCAEPTPANSQRPSQTLGRFEPSPIAVAERMLQLASVTRDDVVFDLGSGDGRIVILAASRHGARGVGVEIERIRSRRGRTHPVYLWRIWR